jgi:hypothetical protein
MTHSTRIKMLLLMVVSMVSMGMAAVTGVTDEGKSLFPPSSITANIV